MTTTTESTTAAAMTAATTSAKEVTYHTRFLTEAEKNDLELLLNGGYHPLQGFMVKEDYDSCLKNMHLANGALWPIPIVLHMTTSTTTTTTTTTTTKTSTSHDAKIQIGDVIKLMDDDVRVIAELDVKSVWLADKRQECLAVAGTDDTNHPYVKERLPLDEPVLYAGGPVRQIGQGIVHSDFIEFRKSPKQTKEEFAKRGWSSVLAFQTRNPLHRSHIELIKRAFIQSNADGVVINPAVGCTQPGDVDYRVRVRCYQHVINDELNNALLFLLPLRMRMVGPKEAVWHALIRKNFGFTHFSCGRDHAGPSSKKSDTGESFYHPLAAQRLAKQLQDEIGLTIIAIGELSYSQDRQQYVSSDEVLPGEKVLNISGTEQRKRLITGEEIPEWFSLPKVVKELREHTKQSLDTKGTVLYFVGLSASGKTTIANRVCGIIGERNPSIKVTHLNADELRRNISKGLGFSKEDRSTNTQRIGYVASLISSHGGIVVVCNIAPYQHDRDTNRQRVEQIGSRHIEIFVDTSFDECKQRDPKGLYSTLGDQKMTGGYTNSWERPTSSDIIINTETESIEDAAQRIVQFLGKL